MVSPQVEYRPPKTLGRSCRGPRETSRFLVKKRPSETAIAAAHDGTSLWECSGILSKACSVVPQDEMKKKKNRKALPRLVVEKVDEKHTDISNYLNDLLLERRPEEEESAIEHEPQHNKNEYTGDDEALEQLGIRNSEDAVQFFSSSRSRRDVSIKFVHLVNAANCPAHFLGFRAANEAKPQFSAPFRPYDLTVLPSATNTSMLIKAGVEFFTMSSEGLVRMGVKGQPSEFIPLTQWMCESACFNTVSSISFFKNYLQTKCFLAWRANVSFLLFRRQRKRVADKLFIGMPTFSPALLGFNNKLYEMRESVKLLDYGTGPVAVSYRNTSSKATKKEKRRVGHGHHHKSGGNISGRVPTSPTNDVGSSESHVIRGFAHHQQYKDANAWFESRQLNAREAASKLLNDGLDEAAKKIHSVLKAVIASAMPRTDGEMIDPQLDDAVNRVLREYEDDSSKPRSMSGLRELERKEKLALRQATHERSLLGDFVRLADYIAVDSLVQITVASWSQLLVEMNKPRRQSGFLETQVFFSETQSTFAPDCQFLQTLMRNLADETVGAVSKILRILFVKPRDPNDERNEERRRRRRQRLKRASREAKDKEETKDEDDAGKKDDEDDDANDEATPEQIAELGLVVKELATSRTHPNVADMITGSSEFQTICSSLSAKVEADFAKAQEYVDSPAFEKIWPIYEFSKSWDFDTFKTKNQTVASLKHELERVSNWQKELDKMRTRQTVGMLDVESRKLRDLLVPSLKDSMEQLKDHTRYLTRAKCRDQHGKFTVALAKIDVSRFEKDEIDSLEQFAAFLGRVESQRAQSRSLMKHAQLAEQMYHLLKEFEIKFAESDSVQMDEIRAMQAKYHDQLDRCESYCEGKMPAVTSKLDEQVADFENSLCSFAEDLGTSFVDVAQGFANPSQQVEQLEQKQTTLDVLCKTDADLKKIHRLLRRERPENTLDNFNQAVTKFDTLKKLWTLVERWVRDLKSWLHDDFFSLDVEQVIRRMKAYQQDVHAVKKSAVDNPVVAELLVQVNWFQAKVPLVECLGSKNLRYATPWKLILEKNGIPEQGYTLDQLVQSNLEQHVDFLRQVADTADDQALTEQVRELLDDVISKIP